MVRILLAILGVAITVYALADCARTPGESMPARLPKALWLLLIVLLTPLGGIAWIIVSRVTQAEAGDGTLGRTLWSSPESVLRSAPRPEESEPLAPDDDPEFLWHLRKEIERKRRQEQQTQTSLGTPAPVTNASTTDAGDLRPDARLQDSGESDSEDPGKADPGKADSGDEDAPDDAQPGSIGR